MTTERDIVERLRESNASDLELEAANVITGLRWTMVQNEWVHDIMSKRITGIENKMNKTLDAMTTMGQELSKWRNRDIYTTAFRGIYGDIQAMKDTNANPLAAKAVEGARG